MTSRARGHPGPMVNGPTLKFSTIAQMFRLKLAGDLETGLTACCRVSL